jgi:hypothetical protein
MRSQPVYDIRFFYDLKVPMLETIISPSLEKSLFTEENLAKTNR